MIRIPIRNRILSEVFMACDLMGLKLLHVYTYMILQDENTLWNIENILKLPVSRRIFDEQV
jgi:hypothetical protein